MSDIHLGGGYVSFGNDLFDSRNRYIRKVANSANKTLNMARGPTIGFSIFHSSSGGSVTSAAFRWRVGDATQVGIDPQTSLVALGSPPDGFNTAIDVAL